MLSDSAHSKTQVSESEKETCGMFRYRLFY